MELRIKVTPIHNAVPEIRYDKINIFLFSNILLTWGPVNFCVNNVIKKILSCEMSMVYDDMMNKICISPKTMCII